MPVTDCYRYCVHAGVGAIDAYSLVELKPPPVVWAHKARVPLDNPPPPMGTDRREKPVVPVFAPGQEIFLLLDRHQGRESSKSCLRPQVNNLGLPGRFGAAHYLPIQS